MKGSHIVVPKLFQGEHAFILQNTDKRIVFAIPIRALHPGRHHRRSGRNGSRPGGDRRRGGADLCAVVNHFLGEMTPADVVWTYSGVRPLFDDGSIEASAVTRDYVFDLDTAGGAPVLSIFGGKITTFRKLAEHALDELKLFFPGMKPAWTDTACCRAATSGRRLRAVLVRLQGAPSLPRRRTARASRGPTARGRRSL